MQVQRAARDHGGPQMVALIEDMELYQIAEALGQNDAETPTATATPLRSGRDLARARWEAHKAGQEPPEPVVDPDSLAFAEQYRRLATG